ncbi:tetratricopeptide repeat-containing response regulator [Rugamonas sp.]|uniref:tetratricopeptide repeat-containing response regulator n=1 Tax=Rugamonas sp. TaxID=1926287 RepID=UPI0025E954D8|nr:tetratricopeptide repeat-containing response regulator [Rugamonas sp.]
MNQMKGLAALIIEPHQGMRASLHNMLNLCGLGRIDDAPNSSQAIRQLTLKQYDLILCEYDLDGGQDGQQMLEDLRHHRLIPPSAIFFMVTGEGQFDKVVSAAELAPADYILKPFAADSILERIARALDKRAAMLPLHQLVEMGSQREAIAAAVAGAARHPRYAVDFQRLRAEMHVALGEPELAEPIYQELYATKNIGWARLGQAKTLYLRARYGEAQAMLEELLGQQRRFVDAYDWLAKTHVAAGQLAQAQAVLGDAVGLSPHAVRRLRRLGEVAFENGDVECAERAFKQVVSRARYSEFRDPEDHARLVQTLVLKGDPVQAAAVIRDLDKTMSAHRNGAVCCAIAAAMLHEYTGNDERLGVALDNALAGAAQAQGLSNHLKIELARGCLLNGRDEQAADVMRSVMRNAGDGAAMDKAVAMLQQSGHGELAQRLERESRQEVVEMVAAGAALAKQGDFRGAVELMLDAVGKLPDNPQVVFNAAVAVLKCLENTGWDERLGQHALALIAGVRRLDAAYPKLNALSTLHQQILKKYHIRAGRRAEAPRAAAV